jgi:hypothetical protein
MKITKDYTIFKEISSNREVDPKHVKRLVRSIEDNNLLHLNPIIVNENMQIIDGQHRLEAARQLGVDICYVMSEDVTKEDIATLNSVSKKWSTMDYVNHFTVEKNPSFIKLSNLINKFPDVAVSTLLRLISEDGRRDMNALREGYVDVTNIDRAYTLFGMIGDLKTIYAYEFLTDRSFIIAFNKVIHKKDFSFDHLKGKIAESPRSFVRCRKESEYIKMILEVYNYKLSKNKLV